VNQRKCPLCGQTANSPHHIKPRAEGGTDEPRNIVYLCRSCHNEIEGLDFTPNLIAKKRLEKLGEKQVQDEEHHYIYRDGGLLFTGIWKEEQQILPTNIFIPLNSTLPMMPENQPKGKRGRKRKQLPINFIADLAKRHYTARQIEKEVFNNYGIKVSYRTIARVLSSH